MTRSLIEYEKTEILLSKEETTLGLWRNGDVVLTGPEHCELVENINNLKKKLKDVCPHDQAIVERGTYTDRGYGCDRYYDAYDLSCNRCKTKFTYNIDNGRRQICEPTDLLEAVKIYESYYPLSAEVLESLNIKRNTVTTVTYGYKLPWFGVKND